MGLRRCVPGGHFLPAASLQATHAALPTTADAPGICIRNLASLSIEDLQIPGPVHSPGIWRGVLDLEGRAGIRDLGSLSIELSPACPDLARCSMRMAYFNILMIL